MVVYWVNVSESSGAGSHGLKAIVVVAADITFHRDGSYEVTTGEEKFTVRDVSLVDTDNKTILSCDLNGRTARSNVVLHKDVIHLFTLVSVLVYGLEEGEY